MGRKRAIIKQYKKIKGYSFDLQNPVTFNEKIQARKLEDNILYVMYADKYAVREYVKAKIGEKYLIPLLFVGENFSKEDFNTLPNSFILKLTNGSGTNIIVFDKTKEDSKNIVSKIKKLQKIEFGYWWFEFFYNKIKPRVIAEKLILDEHGNLPFDYKIHCFNNNSHKKNIIQVNYDRFGNHKSNFYDANWTYIEMETSNPTDPNKFIPKPKKLAEMLEIANKLSEEFNYARVDLYYQEDEIYFGELTFTHGAGFTNFKPISIDKLWGSYWMP